ncbi:MAG: hypothetical protein V2I40_16415 [Desulfobacteraceae bacterium]|jgi:hypothetical protein|nr:hypothetical protein [Desulfobacteraceae bacterium]
MALKLSTGLRNKMLGMIGEVKAQIAEDTYTSNLAFVDGGAGSDTITDDGSNFITAGFAPGDKIFVYGATTGDNDTAFANGVTLTGVAAGTLTFATGTVNTAEAFAATTRIVACDGGALKNVFQDGILKIYSGSQPASPDSAASGTLLLQITVSAGAFVAGAFDNGLEFGDAASGAIAKATGETWQGLGIAAGTAGWFRLCANATDAGAASTSLPRIDGSVGTSNADLNMTTTTITVGATYTVDSFTLTLPEYYGA